MAETPPTPDYEAEPFGAPAREQYEPSYPDRMVQLAERYALPGTEIDWGRHANTDPDNPEAAARRCVLITDEADNIYFVQGRRIYDVAKSRNAGKINYRDLDTPDALPTVTIGDDAPSITNGNRVKSVLIATGRVAGDASTMTERSRYTKNGGDPFSYISRVLEGVGNGVTKAAPPDPGVGSHDGLYDFASARTHDFHDGDIIMGGKKTSIARQRALARGEPYGTVARSRYGVRISPTAPSFEESPGEPPRLLDEWAERRRDRTGALLGRMAMMPGVRLITEHLAERRRQRFMLWEEDVEREHRGERPLPRKHRLL